ncbi:MAG: hypothetical protein AAGE86_07180 [Pseudomonadota bacterium]
MSDDPDEVPKDEGAADGAPSGDTPADDAAATEDDTDADAPSSAPEAGAYGVAPLDSQGAAIYTADSLAAYEKAKAADKKGEELPKRQYADPSNDAAVNIFFGVLPGVEAPPKDQMELQDAIGQVLTTIRKLYLDKDDKAKDAFRIFYVRLYRLAQLGLTGKAMPEVAKTALERVIDDLIQSEAPRVKNQHLKRLGERVAFISVWFVAFYVLISFLDIEAFWDALDIDPNAARSFMLLWVGTSVGAWLSYAIRKADFKLRDLTVVEGDFLEPTTRVIFACLLSTVIGLFILLSFIDVKVGSISISDFDKNPTIALALGVVLGINELMLPSSVAKRAKDIWEKIQ